MIKLIAAVGSERELGKKGELIWRLKGDMAFFKTQTIGRTVVMGANTFKSLPKKLHDRIHYVLTSGSVQDNDGNDVRVFTSVGKLFEEVKGQATNKDVFIIGGQTMYNLFLELADEILLTEIEATDKKADAFFPRFDKSKYTRYVIASNEESGIKYSHVRYVRK
ncbi:MAG: dihydrofolate reductase [Lachnospiraceae bacterium]|nr:dihydrofolate reductase [Lachnospiraceae bacterium]